MLLFAHAVRFHVLAISAVCGFAPKKIWSGGSICKLNTKRVNANSDDLPISSPSKKTCDMSP